MGEQGISVDELFKQHASIVEEMDRLGLLEGPRYAAGLCKKDDRLAAEVGAILALYNSEKKADGKALEHLVGIAFATFVGFSELQSFGSAAGQFDLFVSGFGAAWKEILRVIGVADGPDGILVECKQRVEEKFDTAEMCRMGYYVGQHFTGVGLGVVVSLPGATGWKNKQGKTPKGIVDARLVQVLSHARHGKPIVVLTAEDLTEFAKPGGLLLLLRRRVQELEQLGNHPWVPTEGFDKVDLPEHLKDVFELP